jgi:uncharacterized protein YggU (UPF0235/DUF167 family)
MPKAFWLPVRVKPRNRVNAIEGVRNGSLLISVIAAPEDGKANAALLQVLAFQLKLPKGALSVQRGHSSCATKPFVYRVCR